jgi:hypothetical protein
MPAAITTLRSTLATALANTGVWTVFNHVPEIPLSNSLVIANDDPFILVNSNVKTAIAPTVPFKLFLLVPVMDNLGSQTKLEDYYLAVMTKLAASGLTINITSFSAPAILETPSGNLLQSEAGLEIISEWS